jgi:WD40 repeat protein
MHSSAARVYLPANIYDAAQVDLGDQGIVVVEESPGNQLSVRYYDFDLNEMITLPLTATTGSLPGVRLADDGKILVYDSENIFVWQGTEQIAARQYPYLACVEWRPHHDQLAACTDRGIVLWSPTDGSTPERILIDGSLLVSDTFGAPRIAAWSPSGDWLAAWGERLILVNMATEGPPLQLPVGSGIIGLQFISAPATADSETGSGPEQLLVWSEDGQTSLWSTDGELLRNFDEQCDEGCAVNGALLSPDGERLLTYQDTGVASLWDFANAEYLAPLVGHEASILAAAWYGNLVATASLDGTARIWDTDFGEVVVTLRGHRDFDPVSGARERVLGVQWLEDGRLFTYSQAWAESRSSALPGSLRLWQILDEDGQPLCRDADEPPCHFMSETLVDEYPIDTFKTLRWMDDNSVVSTRFDGTATFWDLSDGKSATLSGSDDQDVIIVWSPTGERLLRYTRDGSGTLWQLQLQEWTESGALAGPIHDVRWLPAGLIVDTDSGVALWNTQSDEPLLSLSDSGLVDAVQPAVNQLIIATDDGQLHHWDVEQGSQLADLDLAEQSSVRHLEAGVDGNTLLAITTSPFSDTITLRDLQTGETTWSWPLPTATEFSISASLSPDQRYVAAAHDGSLYLLAVDQAEPIWIDKVNYSEGVAWNQDGSRFLTWGDLSARLWHWDPTTGRATLLLSVPHYSYEAQPAMNADETQLLTEDADQRLRIWQNWPTFEALIAAAKDCCQTREFSDLQRKEFVLD